MAAGPSDRDELRVAERRARIAFAVEVVAVTLVVAALVALAIWFFFFAGSPLFPYD